MFTFSPVVDRGEKEHQNIISDGAPETAQLLPTQN